MTPIYEHTQKGGWAMWFTGAMTIAISAMFYFMLRNVPLNNTEDKVTFYIALGSGLLAFVVLVWATAFTSALTISIEEGFVKLRFGAGAWRKKFALDDIVSAKTVKSSFWHGWGIHYTGTAWLYNVAGYDAVEITLKNAKKKWLGTDQPKKLATAINNALGGIS
jgi:hypothetical protein